jgi:hypothetical protein
VRKYLSGLLVRLVKENLLNLQSAADMKRSGPDGLSTSASIAGG